MDALSLIAEALTPLAGKRVLDVGCGGGFLAAALARHGADVSGIDPNPEAIAAATRSVPRATFETASAEAMPFGAASFDAVVFLNSLHHVQAPRDALDEAKRVLRGDGMAIVVEPLAQGSSYAALQPIEDEAAVRAEAQGAISAVIVAQAFRCVRDLVFERVEVWAHVDDFLKRTIAVSPDRARALGAARPAVIANFETVAERDDSGRYVLRQPLRAYVLVAVA